MCHAIYISAMAGTLYFRSHNSSWNSTVAFPTPNRGTTIYNIYRITWDQLLDVQQKVLALVDANPAAEKEDP